MRLIQKNHFFRCRARMGGRQDGHVFRYALELNGQILPLVPRLPGTSCGSGSASLCSELSAPTVVRDGWVRLLAFSSVAITAHSTLTLSTQRCSTAATTRRLRLSLWRAVLRYSTFVLEWLACGDRREKMSWHIWKVAERVYSAFGSLVTTRRSCA
jgi:hypothetical protein